MLPLAEGLEGQLVGARQYLAHRVLEIQDRPALIPIEQWEERLERRQHRHTDPQRPLRGLLDARRCGHPWVGRRRCVGITRSGVLPTASAAGRMGCEVHDFQEGVEPMAVTLPAFTPLEDSLFLTLYARALDNRRPHPILGDAVADQLVDKLDYDFGQLHIDTNLILNVALRAKKLDQVASRLLARHPDAVGLDLGAGLDTRVFRVAPPPTVDWYDIDFPEELPNLDLLARLAREEEEGRKA